MSTEDGTLVYAYEVDGLGNSLSDTDDPNVPSLLAAPLLGYTPLGASVFATTHARLLSADNNPFYFAGAQIIKRHSTGELPGGSHPSLFHVTNAKWSNLAAAQQHVARKSLPALYLPLPALSMLQAPTRRGWAARTRQPSTYGRCPGWWMP